ncbi:unnamed protein product [Trifolium pratense]|uniref:Uncharacterized protein n=1 Tax=Trifolium pratense TaxID=57577 RepID=A0ACB0IWN5_TRIPR|nr:unnamed protein product [Trifolium pratense]
MNICIASMCKSNQIVKAESILIDGIKLGLLPDVVTYNTLIDGYSRFVSIDRAYDILNRMKEAGINPNVVSYNSLMSGSVRKSSLSKSLQLFDEMTQLGISPDVWSYNKLMHCLFKLGKPDDANRVFKDIVENGEMDCCMSTYNIMINGLCKNGYVSNALMLFRNLQRNGFVPQVLTYNAMINGLCKARRLVMKCCFRCGKLEQGLDLLSEMRSKGYTFDGFAYSIVVAALVKTGRIEEAGEIAEKMMSNGLVPDLASYNTMINLLCRKERVDEALKLVNEIDRQGLCDQYTHTIIIHSLCKDGNFVDAKKHLDYMNTLGFGFNLVAFNCYLDCLGKAGLIDQALKVFDTMEVKDSFTCTILVHNLCRAKKFIFASKLLVFYIKSGFQILMATQRAVIDGLSTASYNNEARKVKSKIWKARLKH